MADWTLVHGRGFTSVTSEREAEADTSSQRLSVCNSPHLASKLIAADCKSAEHQQVRTFFDGGLQIRRDAWRKTLWDAWRFYFLDESEASLSISRKRPKYLLHTQTMPTTIAMTRIPLKKLLNIFGIQSQIGRRCIAKPKTTVNTNTPMVKSFSFLIAGSGFSTSTRFLNWYIL